MNRKKDIFTFVMLLFINHAVIIFANEIEQDPNKINFLKIDKLGPQKICGREFLFMLRQLGSDKQFPNEELFKESGVYTRINGLDAAISQNTPIIFYAMYTDSEKERIKSPNFKNKIHSLGDRFVGMVHMEGIWNVVKSKYVNNSWPKLMNCPFPTTKEESYRLVEKYFSSKLLLDDIPVCPGSIGFLDHHTLRWGASATTSYWGTNLLFGQLQAAFSRGASRQYKRPWNVYYAIFGLCTKVNLIGDKLNIVIDDVTQYDVRAPEIVKARKRDRIVTYRGPYCGADISTTVRQNYYYAYMSGVNTLENESDSERLRYAEYDTTSTTNPEPPLIRILRDKKLFLSPMTLLQKEIHTYTKRQARGIPYTPFAILLDHHHGYIYPGRKTYFTFSPIEKGDYQINALFNMLFPFKDYYKNLELAKTAKFIEDVPAEQSCFVNLPYGNLFDVLTNDVSNEILNAYPVVILTGKHENPNLFKILENYIRNGGVLIASSAQFSKENLKTICMADISDVNTSGTGYIHPSNKTIKERDFIFYKANQNHASIEYKESQTGLPLVVSNPYHNGYLYICTAPYFMDQGKELDGSILNVFKDLLGRLMKKVMPVHLSIHKGRIDFSLNKLDDSYLVTLINYDGITHSIGKPVTVDLTKSTELTLDIDGEYVMEETILNESIYSEMKNGNTLAIVKVKPGDVKIIKITKR